MTKFEKLLIAEQEAHKATLEAKNQEIAFMAQRAQAQAIEAKMPKEDNRPFAIKCIRDNAKSKNRTIVGVIDGKPIHISLCYRDNNTYIATEEYVLVGEQALTKKDTQDALAVMERIASLPTVEPVVTKDEVEISF
tara:strand:- start:3040 stop:3447 length:408 start_codon:yes stop_codon:yes gene_type:complete